MSESETYSRLRLLEGANDYISNLPDECLAGIFRSLSTAERKMCSLVCRRWLRIEGQSHHYLYLNAQTDLLAVIPSMFSRFNDVTTLDLECDDRSVSIGDEVLISISLRYPNLTSLKLEACRELTDAGISAITKTCMGLKKLSCGSCTFGAKGMNAVLYNCSNLEELSVKRLRGITDAATTEPIVPGQASSSLKKICLKELYNGQCFGPLITGAKNLRTLKLIRCPGVWDELLQLVTYQVTSLVEIHLEGIKFTDVGLAAISNCSDLEILHLDITPECTNLGLAAVAERCRLLRELHIGGRMNRIGDEGLISVAKHCPNLQELALFDVYPTKLSLKVLGSNCQNLERLALIRSCIGDEEISCIAAECTALKKLAIKDCPNLSDIGLLALAGGCPNLIKVGLRDCRGVTTDCTDWLTARIELIGAYSPIR